jgi:hypothetical protein
MALPAKIESRLVELLVQRGQPEPIDFLLQYRLGRTPEGFPDQVRLTAPPLDQVPGLIEQYSKSLDNCLPLGACWPADVPVEQTYQRLTFECLGRLMDAAWCLTLGDKLAAYIAETPCRLESEEGAFGG